MCYTDNSVDCNYYSTKPSQTSAYIIVIVTSLVIAVIVLILVSLLYLIYCRHGKKSTSYVGLDLAENDHHDTSLNDHQPTVQPAQEAGSSGDQLQVGFTKSSQSQCSKSTLEDSFKYMENCYTSTVPLSSKSSLVGLHSNWFDTVT